MYPHEELFLRVQLRRDSMSTTGLKSTTQVNLEAQFATYTTEERAKIEGQIKKIVKTCVGLVTLVTCPKKLFVKTMEVLTG